jgi:nucleotide-binding universal stress UspA family protein
MVPLDGSGAAETALPWTIYLADVFQAEIVLFHAIEKNPPEDIHGENHLANLEEASTYLESVKHSLHHVFHFKGDISTHVHLEETTDVAASIAMHMKELGPDLVAMCSHGRSNFTQAFIGSLATRVIGLGQVPIFLVKSHESAGAESSGEVIPSVSNILVALDNASIHDKAIRSAEEFAKNTEARLVLFSAVPRFGSLKGRDGGWGLMSPATSSTLLDIEEDKMRQHLDEHRKSLSERGVAGSSAVVRGDPARKIAQEAKKLEPSLIVLGTHGRSGMEAFWKGSVAAKVVSLTDAPILLVPLHE